MGKEMSERTQFKQVFLVEAAQLLAEIERELPALERDCLEHATLDAIFRAAHTLKGSSAIYGFKSLSALTHQFETQLSIIREQRTKISRIEVDALLRGVGQLRSALEISSAGESISARDEADLPRQFNQVLMPLTERAVLQRYTIHFAPKPAFFCSGNDPIRILRELDSLGSCEVVVDHQALPAWSEFDPESCYLTWHISLDTSVNRERIAEVFEWVEGIAVTSISATPKNASECAPLATIFDPLSPVVFELARKLSKRVELHVSGGEIELECALLTQLNALLLHLVRNALDHGIESEAQRVAQGKFAHGTLSLHAHFESKLLILEVKDDGAGLDEARIRTVAETRGLVPRGAPIHHAQMTELIFAPGLSTAHQITDISGRGVGLDVVREHLERVGGRIAVNSVPRVGTTFRIEIPRSSPPAATLAEIHTRRPDSRVKRVA